MDLKSRIDGFFNGTLTYDEEQELYLYLCSNDVPPSLQRDKEAILALCTDTNDYTLPAGARERLTDMLDALNNASPVVVTAAEQHVTPIKKVKRIPKYIWCFAAAVMLIILLCVSRTQTAANKNNGVAYEQDASDTSTIKTFVLSEPEVIPLTESEIEALRKDSTGVVDCKNVEK